MPIYPQSDVPPSVMDNVLQAPTGFDVSLPEGTNPEPQKPQPSVWGAAFRQNNSLVGMVRIPKQFEPVDGYNPYADKNELQGYSGVLTLRIHNRRSRLHGLKTRSMKKMKIGELLLRQDGVEL